MTKEEVFKTVIGHDVPPSEYMRGSFTWYDIKSLMDAYSAQENNRLTSELSATREELERAKTDVEQYKTACKLREANSNFWKQQYEESLLRFQNPPQDSKIPSDEELYNMANEYVKQTNGRGTRAFQAFIDGYMAAIAIRDRLTG